MRRTRQYSSPACSLRETRAKPYSTESPRIRVKRIYDPAARGDGFRVLVDRLWPRGLRKDRVQIDAWQRELAPSPALRKWFGHQVPRWAEFRTRYRAELHDRESDLEALRHRAEQQPLTLLHAARDTAHNHALVLKEVLEE
jgi:uncharacterized protein YeaO (DUF488 family)